MKPFRKQTAPRRRDRNDRQSQIEARPASFRPGRTLTGSHSGRVTSSNELNAEFKSPRAHVHHLSRLRRRILTYFVGALILASALYVLVSQLIGSVALSTGALHVPADRTTAYTSRISDYLAHHPAERLYPTLNLAGLTAYLQTVYPEIRQVRVEPSGSLGRAEILVSLRQPVARWVLNGNDEFVDDSGVVFGYNAYQTPPLQIIDQNRTTLSGGNLVTSHRFLAFVGLVAGDAAKYGYKVTKATIPVFTTRQLEIKLKGIRYPFKLTIDRSAGEQVEDMSRLISYMKRKSITPAYVDVRVEGKAFYK